MPNDPHKPRALGAPGEPLHDDERWHLAGGLLGSDEPVGMMALASRVLGEPKRSTAEALDGGLTRLWLDLWDYEEEHPSERARLAKHLIRAAQQLLRDEQNEDVRTTPASRDGRTKLANGAKTYLETRGEPFTSLNLSWSITVATDDVRRAIKNMGLHVEEKKPALKDHPTVRAALVAWGISDVLWDHKNWSTFRKLLRQKRQPTTKPNYARLLEDIEGIFKGKYASSPIPPPPDTWPDLAARVLAAAVRVAGCDDRFADNILRGERGTPKGEQSGTVDSPRKQSGTVDTALLPQRKKRER